ncbi:alpha amylase [Niallia nealsonii AAU1]|nr:alpha amylase [Niallia nealsonii AAU1]
MELKQVLNKWQKGLENKGWNALFIENHDKARSVSTWGNDKEYWKESAKALGMMYFFMQGTPFIYQGQEIGMTNVQFPTIEEYDDVATKNLYKLKREEGVSHKDIMEIIWSTSRDNSRTPMQWSSEEYAGFSKHTPWMGINPNYLDINVESQKKDTDSIYHFYKKMIELKKSGPILTYGTFDLVDEDNKQVFAYTRTLDDKKMVIITNLSAEEAVFENRVVELEHENLLLANYPVEEHEPTTSISLKPYEARLYICK